MNKPDDSISNVNSKSAVKDERTLTLFNMSDDLIARSKRLTDNGKVLRDYLETLETKSLQIISYSKKHF